MDNNMKLIYDIYQKSIADNEKNLKFWESYLNNLEALSFHSFADKLKVPTLVPIGSKIFFRGELKHTNEVTVSLGADYFVKCSIAQAEILREHRIRDAQSKVGIYKKEKEHLENQISFSKQNVYETDGQEILEVYSEEEDRIWREMHKENVRKYKQGNTKDKTMPKDDMNDDQLWERLEELELQEELENEMLDNYNEIIDKRKENSFLINEEKMLLNSFRDEKNMVKLDKDIEEVNTGKSNPEIETVMITEASKVETINGTKLQDQFSKEDLLRRVLDKQNELEHALHEIKCRERKQSKSEQDLLTKLDEMEQLEELEDEIERLDDMIETKDVESDDDLRSSDPKILMKSISFADNDDSETIDIHFTHSEVDSNDNPYNPETGIKKPSDLYKALPNLFDNKTTSILKKSKYGQETKNVDEQFVKDTKKVNFEETFITSESAEPEEKPVDRTIIIKDVVETVGGGVNQHMIEGGARPTSLFKKKRMQNRS